MTDTTRDAFEVEVLKNKAAFQIRRIANGDYQNGSTQELWEYWQAATLAERGRCAGLVMEAPASMVALHENICNGRPLPPTATPQGKPS